MIGRQQYRFKHQMLYTLAIDTIARIQFRIASEALFDDRTYNII